jgi:hypothetical protein
MVFVSRERCLKTWSVFSFDEIGTMLKQEGGPVIGPLPVFLVKGIIQELALVQKIS